MLNDGPEADAWLGLMEKWGTIDELVTFFYDSLSGMMGRAEEFFDCHMATASVNVTFALAVGL
jgi:hypothetical protein